MSDGRADMGENMKTRPATQRANGILLCQSVSDRFDVDGESAALAFGHEISERRWRHAVEGGWVG